jgi:hypothetical protein
MPGRANAERLVQDLTGGDFPTDGAFIVFVTDIGWVFRNSLILQSFSDSTRPAAGTAGRVIWNTDDGFPNFDDGTNWVTAAGAVT